MDIYDAKRVITRHESRIDFHHGANNFMYIRGNSTIYDSWVLTNVLEKNFIDTRNVESDFEISKEFTWEFRDLVEIKKRKRVVERVIQPSMATFIRLQSAAKRALAIKSDSLVSRLAPHPNMSLYEYFDDKFADDKDAVKKLADKHLLNVTNAG